MIKEEKTKLMMKENLKFRTDEIFRHIMQMLKFRVFKTTRREIKQSKIKRVKKNKEDTNQLILRWNKSLQFPMYK